MKEGRKEIKVKKRREEERKVLVSPRLSPTSPLLPPFSIENESPDLEMREHSQAFL